MFNNVTKLLGYAHQQLSVTKKYCEEFRLYGIGSFAINHFASNKGFTKNSNIAYGTHTRHRLDLFKTHQPKEHRPLIVFVHGGAWSYGDKKDYHFLGQSFATEGYDVAVINYRLAPNYIFPSYVDDLVLAVDYLVQHQSELEISTEQLIFMGHSAGAFNVISAIYSPQNYHLSFKENIKAIIGLAGPYHFDYKNDPLCADAFDQDVPYQDVMPYYFVEKNAIKHYLFMAENDRIVADTNTIDLDFQLRAHHNHSEIIVIPKTGHITIMGSVASLFSSFFRTKPEIIKALDEALN